MKGRIGLYVFVLCALLVLAAAGVKVRSDAPVLYAKPTASGSGDCSSWANACTLQAALDKAVQGDQIWVAAGIHRTRHRWWYFWLVTGVEVYGGFPSGGGSWEDRDWETNVTVLSGDWAGDDISDANGVITDVGNIRGSNSFHVIHSNGVDETAVLDGFTITGGAATEQPGLVGGGMYNYNNSSPTLRNLTFSGNFAYDHGGGMYNYNNSSPTLRNLTFSGNFAYYDGGGMYNYNNSSPTLTNVLFSGNKAGFYGGGMRNETGSSPTLTDCSFSGNSALSGGGMANYIDSSPTLTNVTFRRNTGFGHGGGMRNETTSSPMLTDCEFINNGAEIAGGMYNIASSPTLTNVLFSENRAVNGNGGGMGNEMGSSPVLSNTKFISNTASGEGGGMYNDTAVTATLSNVEFTGNTAVLGAGMYNHTAISATLTHCTFINNTADSGGGMYNWDSSPVLTATHFVSNTVAGSGGGMHNHWYSSPKLTNVTFSGNSAIYDGGGMYNVIYSSPVLTATHFVSNTADEGGGMDNRLYCSPVLTATHFVSNTASSGGGMRNSHHSSPTLTDCAFISNSASSGGGMYNHTYGSPKLTNVTFSGNSATDEGGGMSNLEDSSPTLINVTLSQNSAARGGGMANTSSSPRLINVTLSGNDADRGGGMHNEEYGGTPSHAELLNTIVWGNRAEEGAQIYDEGLPAKGTSCLVEGGYVSCDVLSDVSPFVAPYNLHLARKSAAIDEGLNSLVPAGVTTDLDGNTRVFGDRVDLGAYEAQCWLWHASDGDRRLEDGQQYRLGFHHEIADPATVTISDTLASYAAERATGNLTSAKGAYETALECAATSTEMQQAVAGINSVIWELATGAMLEGNELLVQALDVTNASESPDAEITLLEDAVDLYSQATDGYLQPLAGDYREDFLAALQISRTHPISDSGAFIETYVDLERLAAAAAKKSRATLELAERYFRNGYEAQAGETVVASLNEATVELALLYNLWPEVVEDVNYAAVLRNMEDMDRLYRYLQEGRNPFGYGPECVPFAYHPDVADQSNYHQAKYIADDKYDSAETEVSTAQGKQQEIDDDYDELQKTLNESRTFYEGQLVALCGSKDVTECDGGEIGDKLYDIQTAMLGVERSLQQMEDQNALIRIEQERVAKVAGIHRATAQLITDTGEELAGLAAQEARLRFSKSTAQGVLGIFGGIFSGATSMGEATGSPWGALAGGIIGGVLEAGNWAAEADVAEDLADVYAAKERLYAKQKAAVQYAEGEIAEADSLALQKKLFLQFAQLEIDYAIAMNNLMQEVARLQTLTTQVLYVVAERDKAEAFTSLLFRDPAGRVLRDRYMELAHYRYEVALEWAYLAGRALEYELNQEVTFEGLPLVHLEDLYPLQDTVFLDGALEQMDDEYDAWTLEHGAPQDRTDTVYLSRLVGFEDSYDPDLGRLVTREEKFNAFVRDPANRVDRDNDGYEELEFDFQTSIYPQPGVFPPFPPLQVFNDKIEWINMRVWGDELSVDGRPLTQVDVSLRQDGVSLMRTQDSRVHVGGEDDIRSYNLDRKTATVQAAISDTAFPQDNKELFSRSVANTRWTIHIAGEAQNLNLDNIDEIELLLHCEAYTLQTGAPGATQEPDLAQAALSRPYQPMRQRLPPTSLKGSAPGTANLGLTAQTDATDLNGAYVGWAIIDQPPYMPPVSLIAVLTETEGLLGGYLTPTLECPTMRALAGSWSGESFELQSEPFTMTMTTGVTITRQVFLHTGVISEAGKIITGAYRETVAGLTPEPLERVGEFRLERPARLLEAGFAANPVCGPVPLEVEFEDLSLGDPTTWAWDFGDGAVSTEQDPIHTYDQPGSYTVTLTVANAAGLEDTLIEPHYVLVTEPAAPVANFSASPRSGYVPLTVDFEDRSAGGPTHWLWDFGDGSSSSVQDPSHTYTATGSYAITLSVSNAFGSDTRTKANYISATQRPAPVANFSASPRSGYVPLTVYFEDLSTGDPTHWLWDFGDGSTSGLQNPSHTYTAVGSYTITLTVSNASGSDTRTEAGYISVTQPAHLVYLPVMLKNSP